MAAPRNDEARQAAIGCAVIVVILLMVVGCVVNAVRGDDTATPRPTVTPPPTAPKLAASPLVTAPPTSPATPVPGGEQATVARVIDGDTFELDDGRTVRVLGIDSCEKGTWGGESARIDADAHLTPSWTSTVILVKEPTAPDTDRYGRLLRYVKFLRYDDTWQDFGLEMVQWDHTGIYNPKNNDASPEYLEQLYAADTRFSLNPPSGRECGEPWPPTSSRDDDGHVHVDIDDDDDHHRESRFCRKRWWC